MTLYFLLLPAILCWNSLIKNNRLILSKNKFAKNTERRKIWLFICNDDGTIFSQKQTYVNDGKLFSNIMINTDTRVSSVVKLMIPRLVGYRFILWQQLLGLYSNDPTRNGKHCQRAESNIAEPGISRSIRENVASLLNLPFTKCIRTLADPYIYRFYIEEVTIGKFTGVEKIEHWSYRDGNPNSKAYSLDTMFQVGTKDYDLLGPIGPLNESSPSTACRRSRNNIISI